MSRRPYFRITITRWLSHWFWGTEKPWIWEDTHPIQAWLERMMTRRRQATSND